MKPYKDNQDLTSLLVQCDNAAFRRAFYCKLNITKYLHVGLEVAIVYQEDIVVIVCTKKDCDSRLDNVL